MGADKILHEGDENSNKMNTITKTRLRLNYPRCQDHTAIGVLLVLGTNTHQSVPDKAVEN
jgi:hypothetical protein